jgi:hypothetical protein
MLPERDLELKDLQLHTPRLLSQFDDRNVEIPVEVKLSTSKAAVLGKAWKDHPILEIYNRELQSMRDPSGSFTKPKLDKVLPDRYPAGRRFLILDWSAKTTERPAKVVLASPSCGDFRGGEEASQAFIFVPPIRFWFNPL